jgi:hypothetical protein
VRKLPWKDLAPVGGALVALGVAWAVARGLVDDQDATVVNAAAAALVAIIIAVSAFRGARTWDERSRTELAGEYRSALIDGVRSRWIGTRDDTGRLAGNGKLAQDLVVGVCLDVRLDQPVHGGAPVSAVRVSEAWQQSAHHLVLTGEAGAGKSVQLLLLVETLLDRAAVDATAGVPVIVGLAPWAERTFRSDATRLVDWLVVQLHDRYSLPKAAVRRWLANGDLIPVLDGLDEVPHPACRSSLFNHLVTWARHSENPPAAWALGCRLDEYLQLDPEFRSFGSRSAYWRVRDLDDSDRIRFLESANLTSAADWGPVIEAIRHGEVPHLTETTNDGQGVLATPLGLRIAVEAFGDGGSAADAGRPSDLLDYAGDWDLLWSRYVLHRYVMSYADPADADDHAGQFSLPDAQRWLGTLASGKVGLPTVIDVTQLEMPTRPAGWSVLSEAVREPTLVLRGILGCLVPWLVLFSAFGAVVGWREWDGLVGVLVAVAVAGVCAAAVAASLAGEYVVAAGIAVAGIPGLLALGAGLRSPGVFLAERLQPVFDSLDGYGLIFADNELRLGDVQLGTTGAGALTGAVVALVTAGVLLASFALCALAVLVQLYRSRDREASSSGIVGLAVRHLGWLFDAEEGYKRLVATHFTLRWWYYGTPARSKSPSRLLPHPKDWERFLGWAAHCGFVRRVGSQHVWTHDKLRVWFQRYEDDEGTALLLGRRMRRDERADEDEAAFDADYHSDFP